MSQNKSSHVLWTLPSSTFSVLHFIVFVAHNNNHKVETHQVSKGFAMEVNTTMMELSPQAIEIGLVYDQVRVKGQEVVNDLQDRALALYDHAEEHAYSTVEDVKAVIEVQKKHTSSFLQRNGYAAVTSFRKAIFRGCSSMIRVVPPFGSSHSDQRRDVCSVNVGITLALVLTVILITVQACCFLKWLISKIRLAMVARFTAADPDSDDDDDSFFDCLNNSDGGEVAGAGDGLTQVRENEGATTTPVVRNTTTLEPAEDDAASPDDQSTTENHVTDEPTSSASEHEGDSPAASNSSVLGLGLPETLMRDPLMRSPSAPLRR